MRSALFLILFLGIVFGSTAGDSSVVQKKSWYQTRTFKAVLAPVIIGAYGASIIKNHGLYSSYNIRKDIQYNFSNFYSPVDEYLRFAPIVCVYGLDILGLKAKNSFLNRSAMLFKSEVLMAAMVYSLKYTTGIIRPNGEDDHSFPSGHTAQAFVAATFMHKELGYKSFWYSVGAYTAASATGIIALLNDRHWASDVLVGAGLGILSVNLVYMTHQYKWGKINMAFYPMINKKNAGILVSFKL